MLIKYEDCVRSSVYVINILWLLFLDYYLCVWKKNYNVGIMFGMGLGILLFCFGFFFLILVICIIYLK